MITLTGVACTHQPSRLDEYVTLQRRSLSMDQDQVAAARTDQADPGDRDSRIRRALVLASPGRSKAELTTARDELQEILTKDAPTSAAVRDYLVLTLRYVEQRLTLRSQGAEYASKLRQLENENKTLKEQLQQADEALSEAENKLEALTKIEKSIERPSGDQNE